MQFPPVYELMLEEDLIIVLFNEEQHKYHIETAEEYQKNPNNNYEVVGVCKSYEKAAEWIKRLKK